MTLNLAGELAVVVAKGWPFPPLAMLLLTCYKGSISFGETEANRVAGYRGFSLQRATHNAQLSRKEKAPWGWKAG